MLHLALIAYLIISGAFLLFGFWACLPALIPLARVWFKQRDERRSPSPAAPDRVTEPPSDLPAAAVSELMEMVATPGIDEEDDADYRIHLTVAVEMIHKDTLRLVVDGAESGESDEFTYRLEAQPGPKSAWEQALCDVWPQGSLDGPTLRAQLNFLGLGVRGHLRQYLEDRGLVSHPNAGESRTGPVWPWALLMWIGILFSMGAVVIWMEWWGLVWWPGMVTIGVMYWGAVDEGRRRLEEVRGLTDRGQTEVVQWRLFGQYLGSLTFTKLRLKDSDGTDPLMPYAFALNRMDTWNRASPRRGPLPEFSVSRSDGSPFNPKTAGLDAAMLLSAVAIPEGGLDTGLDLDLDL